MTRSLTKSLSVGRGVGLAVTMVVGTGLLGLPGLALEAGGTSGAIFSWLLTALVTIPLIYVFSHLGVTFPSCAGLARYAEAAAGPLHCQEARLLRRKAILAQLAEHRIRNASLACCTKMQRSARR